MKSKPQLVLDIAGVLVNNISSDFWEELGRESGVTFQVIKERFDEIRRNLWTGILREDQFWIWLVDCFPGINKERSKENLIRSLELLQPAGYLEQWSQNADIHLLSNHCKEWIDPILTSIKRYTKNVIISNQVGLCKPDTQIYELIESRFESKDRVLYVDDQEKNLKPANKLGWNTLLADNQNKWVNDVERFIRADV
ncbi:HAD-IA family hydrolase [Cohnella lubricantis]|uniref:HAD-IA family hydrolase n=1 Tax=Cohnella lubricantis TaxID=2163172 RepID=A0A841TFD4_9BACL|nr:HAD-IA family hydrolase [Cohnella lubricantis]MBB6677998.1 HAD-IA family hydrolase [Cohnella lubricantis]MBP2120540.1 putative hydrolase of the HAD superfamily [Cohnella lubricantis]